MTSKGKHSSDGSGGFYRDLAMMIGGIILVGAAVFLLLFLLADNPSPTTTEPLDTTTTPELTTTTVGSTTSSSTTTTPTTTTIPLRPPSEVRVVVLNSIGLTGAAGRLTSELSDAGYQTLEADDYEPEQDPSRIWYRDGFAPEASELLAFIPGATVEALPDATLAEGADVVIMLGAGYEE